MGDASRMRVIGIVLILSLGCLSALDFEAGLDVDAQRTAEEVIPETTLAGKPALKMSANVREKDVKRKNSIKDCKKKKEEFVKTKAADEIKRKKGAKAEKIAKEKKLKEKIAKAKKAKEKKAKEKKAKSLAKEMKSKEKKSKERGVKRREKHSKEKKAKERREKRSANERKAKERKAKALIRERHA